MRWGLACVVLGLALLASSAHARKVSEAARQQARQDGSVRVIVLLGEAGASAAPATAVRPDGVSRLHPPVAADVDALLARLPARARGDVLRRFDRVPALVLRADAAMLSALERDAGVARVDLDAGGGAHAGMPDAASNLNEVEGLAGLGLGGAGMKVAVIDSGIASGHPDFGQRIVGQQCYCSVGTGCCPNGAPSQSGAGAAEDDNGHGTNVAGIIAGDGGIAPRGALPSVAIVAVKVLDSNNRYQSMSDVIAALDWLAAHHPDVDAVNLSLGSDALFAGDCDGAAGWTQALAVAVGNLQALGAAVVASAGNQRSAGAMGAPACIRDVVSTAATWDFSGGAITFLGCTEASTEPGKPACFSNRSTTTDLFAAGAFVTAPGLGGGTATFGGTSQASPMVAACAVALKQGVPQASHTQRLDALLLSPTRVFDPVSGRSHRFLECRDALALLDPQRFALRMKEGGAPRRPPTPATAAPGPSSAQDATPARVLPPARTPERAPARGSRKR